MGSLLPVSVVLALLRSLRGTKAHPGDDDLLFDEFGCVDESQALARAATALLGNDHRNRAAALDAALVEMLRDHATRRKEAA